MKPATLPRWAIGALIFFLFAVLPAVAHLIDGPSEIDVARAVATDKTDAIEQAQRVARRGEAQ